MIRIKVIGNGWNLEQMCTKENFVCTIKELKTKVPGYKIEWDYVHQ